MLPPTQTFLGVRDAFLPLELDLSGAFFRAWLYSSRKDQEGLMKGEDLTVLEQTTQLTQKRSY